MGKYTHVQQKLKRLHGSLPWTHMAKECGISATTIKKFANNETYRPQFHTVDVLADYAGFALTIADLRKNVLPGAVLKLRRVK